jgi:hypothetical protein
MTCESEPRFTADVWLTNFHGRRDVKPGMNAHRVAWGHILLAGFLAEASVMAVFFLLLGLAWLAGMPEIAAPMSTLDYVDALVASFVSIFLFTLWVGRRLEGGFVLHGILIAAVAMSLFLLMIGLTAGSIQQPILYWVAHGLKFAGGIAGGIVAERRRRPAPAHA